MTWRYLLDKKLQSANLRFWNCSPLNEYAKLVEKPWGSLMSSTADMQYSSPSTCVRISQRSTLHLQSLFYLVSLHCPSFLTMLRVCHSQSRLLIYISSYGISCKTHLVISLQSATPTPAPLPAPASPPSLPAAEAEAVKPAARPPSAPSIPAS